MCPVCAVTIFGGLWVAGKLGAEDLLLIGVAAVVLSLAINSAVNRLLKGKKGIPFQKVVITALALILATVTAQFLL